MMPTHPAVIANGIKQPLTIGAVPTPLIQSGEVQVRVEWVPSAPLDVYQVDAGLMAEFPQSLGDTAAGTVVAAADDVKRLKVGDKVFGFFFHNKKEKAQQIYVTAREHLFAKVCWTFSDPSLPMWLPHYTVLIPDKITRCRKGSHYRLQLPCQTIFARHFSHFPKSWALNYLGLVPNHSPREHKMHQS